MGRTFRVQRSWLTYLASFREVSWTYGSAIPERLTGSKVASMISSERGKDPIEVSPDTLVSDA